MVAIAVWTARNGLLLTRLCGSKMDYRSYITSTEWRSKHKDFLKSSHYRCAFFPWVKVGKKHRYNVHHMNYKNLGF
jgi:hypothetical protein